MKMRRFSLVFLSLALLGIGAAQFAGCEKYILPEITLSQDTLRFQAALDSQVVHITTNVVTTAEPATSDQRWISTNPVWFDETSDVVVTVQENTTGAERTATIPIKSETILKNLVVIQESY